jgi:hypothetical protein
MEFGLSANGVASRSIHPRRPRIAWLGGTNIADLAGCQAETWNPPCGACLDNRTGSRVGFHPSFLSVTANGGRSMGSARDSTPDPKCASGLARPPWPSRVRPGPMSGIAPATLRQSPGAPARADPKISSLISVPPRRPPARPATQSPRPIARGAAFAPLQPTGRADDLYPGPQSRTGGCAEPGGRIVSQSRSIMPICISITQLSKS